MRNENQIIINKTLNVLDLNRFQEEIKAHNSKVVFVFKIGIDNLRITLSEALTAQEDLGLDTLISAFEDSDPEQLIPLIMDIVKPELKNKPFHGIKYTGTQELLSALIPDRESGTVKGEVQEVIWYRTLVETTPTTPVLKVNIQYFRDTTGFATYRLVSRTYFNRDGSENSDVRSSIKYYFVNKQDMVDEGVKRRTLLVKSIQIPSMQLIAEVLMPLGVTMPNVVAKGRQFMDDYDVKFRNFENNSSSITNPLDEDFGMKSIIVKLRDDTTPRHTEWLDKMPNSLGGSTSIRNYLISEFTI